MSRLSKLGCFSQSRITVCIFFLIAATAMVACGKIEREEVRTDAYPFASTKVDDCNLTKGQTQTKQQGRNGTIEITEKVTYANDKETKREKLSEKVTLKPMDEILVIGGLSVQKSDENQKIPFATINQENASIPCGQTTILQEGKEGSQTVSYEITFKCGKQDGEKKAVGTPTILSPPIDKIIGIGLPCPVGPDPGAPGTPPGATARCNDGTYSYSANHRGTCSHHGGVAEWYR